MTEIDTTEETDEQFDARMRAGLGLDSTQDRLPDVDSRATLPSKPYVALHVGVDSAPPWDVDPDVRPATVTAALQALTEAADAANALADRLAALPGERAKAESDFEREAVAADRAGRAPKFAKRRDFEQERAVLEAQHRGRVAAYGQARTDYQQAVRDARQEWFDALVAKQQPARAAALEGLSAASEAVSRVAHFRGVVNATATLWGELNPEKSAPPLDLRAAAALGQALVDVRGLLQSEDNPAVTGAWMTETLDPPRHVRESWFNSGGGALLELMRIELAENFEHTDFTRAWAAANGYLKPAAPLATQPVTPRR